MAKKIFYISLSVVLGLAIWSLIVVLNPTSSLPNLKDIYMAFAKSESLVSDLVVSITTLMPGLISGIFLGIIAGVITGRVLALDLLFSPILNFVRSMPPVALAPIFIVLLGIDFKAKVFIIALGVFFPVWINTYSGIKSLPDDLKYLSKDFGLSWIDNYTKIILPFTLPYMITGIRVSIAFSLIMLFVSEWIASTAGIGYSMAVAHTLDNMDDLFIGVIQLGLISIILDTILQIVSKFYLPWIGK